MPSSLYQSGLAIVDYAALSLFILVGCITPGPNNLMILASGVNYGIRPSLPHLFGINLGFTLMVMGVGLGMAGVFALYPMLHEVLKVLGSVYLLWLAWKIASAPVQRIDIKKRKPFSFLQAALFQWVNPKAWILATGTVVTFSLAHLEYSRQVVEIAILYLVLGMPCTATWLGFGTGLKRFLASPPRLRTFNVSMGLLLALSLWPVLAELWQLFYA
ncbi:LysE family translocator [Aliiglaciecola sp. CAU 1673]|uniref:LysE family translocator n=1 Tax=Aliiglaciecola sp. CAU 1673 TaxID=3032595 RepID=UPI0023DAA3AE|nr:LysE family translocator [Aliiglaciecola sp. CAU 1673]MDF2178396.1 LysE family translocator [Aliiglaciecola sp. CAU 1673]